MIQIYQKNADGLETILNVPTIEGAERYVKLNPEKYSFEKRKEDIKEIEKVEIKTEKITDESIIDEIVLRGFSREHAIKVLSEM